MQPCTKCGNPEAYQVAGEPTWYCLECGVKEFNLLPIIRDFIQRLMTSAQPMQACNCPRCAKQKTLN